MKRIGRTLLFVLLLFAGTSALAAEPDVPESTGTYVQDHAKILTAEQQSQIEEMASNLEQGTGAQIVILTLPSAIEVPEMYGVEAYRKLGLGTAEEDNGVLLLVSTVKNSSGDRAFEITVGYGLEGALPDGKVGRIIEEYGVPYLRKPLEDPQTAIMNVYPVLHNEVAKEYNWDGTVEQSEPYAGTGSDGGGGINPIVTIIIIFVLFNMFFGGGGRGGGGGGPGGRRRRGGPFIFIPGSFGGGGGGFGGGGFGGGGGGFTGGGGSTGGGGAGRGW
ncbi:uncharacterized protein SAMN04488127_2928 [Bhargavaea ginsengi]|uniref:TPM domain-containing protein n=1 Tax=Bhargavaea ginsengi TaxID=426757 RepID=A0A1H7BZ83_9BACL|nr:TPM domain-containing protein [Bhargavaea ginsengi]SEJ82516.1 uncharacterized protein SAMN04488127_2928 [Bhargavaea ginsengi]